MLAYRLRCRASICPTLVRRLVFAGIPVCMGDCMGYSVATLPQRIPTSTGHWPIMLSQRLYTAFNAGPASAWHWAIDLCFSGMILVHDFISDTSQWARSIRVALAQCLSNVEDVVPALYRCCTGVLYLLGLQQQYMRSR